MITTQHLLLLFFFYRGRDRGHAILGMVMLGQWSIRQYVKSIYIGYGSVIRYFKSGDLPDTRLSR